MKQWAPSYAQHFKLCLNIGFRITSMCPYPYLSVAVSVLLLWNLLSPFRRTLPDFDLGPLSFGDNQSIPVNGPDVNPQLSPQFSSKTQEPGCQVRQQLLWLRPKISELLGSSGCLPNHLPDLFPKSCLGVDVCFDRRLMHTWIHNFLIYCRCELITLPLN